MATKIRPPEKADVTALLRNLFLQTEQELIKEITRIRLRHPCRAIWIVMQALLVALQVIRIDLHK